MTKIKVYNLKGEETSDLSLEPSIFGVSENDNLVSQAVRIQLANARNAIAHTKTRGEVSGGGKSLGNKKELVMLGQVHPAHQFGAVVV